MSTLSLAKNGYVSSSKRTKHIKVKYLYIKHHHALGELTLQYFPTEEMWADVLTKPLQGSKFRKFRSILMNCPENYSEDPPFFPLTHISSNTSVKPRLSLPRQTKPSPRECVESQEADTNRSAHTSMREQLNSVPIKPTKNDVSWRDSLFPRRHPSADNTLRRTSGRIHPTAE